jgi:hypothetical protein
MTQGQVAPAEEVVELEHWEPSRDITVVWLAVALVAWLPVSALFALVAAVSNGGRTEILFDGGGFVLLAALIVGTLILHEAVHGAAVLGLGRRPTFGVGLLHGMPYLSTTANATFLRDEFIAIALAPLVAISAGGLALMLAVPPWSPWLVPPLAINALGAIGDLHLTLVALRYPRPVLIRDERTGIRVLGRRADRRARPPTPATPSARRRWLRALLGVLPVAVLSGLLGPMVLVLLLRAAGVVSLEIPGLLTIENEPPRFTLGLFLPGLFAIAGAAIALAATRLHARG